MFENENTFIRMSERKEEAKFHETYEKALEEVKGFFGREYPNIAGKEIDYYQVRRKAMSLMLKTLGPQRLRIFYSMDRFCSAAGFQ